MIKFVGSAIVASLLLSSCATNPRMDLIHACESWVGTKNTLTTLILADELSMDQVLTIKDLVPVVDQYCSGELPTDTASIDTRLSVVQDAINTAIVKVK